MLCKLFVKAGSPFQVDGFPKDSKRSVKGSLHFRPQTSVIITEDEWKKIKDDGLQDRFSVVEKIKEKTTKKIPVNNVVEQEPEEFVFEKKEEPKKKKKKSQ